MRRIESGGTDHGTSPRHARISKTSSGLVGAIAAAVVASICCVVPLMLLTLGISGAWMSSLTALEPYRPLFIIVTLAFLGFAFYQVHRKPTAQECERGSYCANARSRTINRASLWIVTVLIGGLLSFPYIAPRLYATTSTVERNGTATVRLAVENMHCATCPIAVRQSLMQVPGVHEARVSAVPPEASVTYDPGLASMKDLTDAITRAGYPSSVKEDGDG